MFPSCGHKIFFKVNVLNGLWVFTDSKNLISFRQESSEKMFRFRSTLWATEPNRVVKFKKKNFFFFLIKITISIWGKVIFVQNRLEQAILGPLRAPKLSKMAILGSFSQFDAHLAIFLAGTRWNSPLKVKIEAMSMSMPSKKTL